VLEGVPRVDHAPGHRRRAGAVLLDEAHGVRARLGVDDVVDVALAPDGDGLAAMAGHRHVAHALEQLGELLRLGMGELDEFETVGPGGVVGADLGGRRVVRERTHLLLQSAGCSARCVQWRKS